MPIVEVEGQRFEFPEGTSDEVIGNAIRQHFATQDEIAGQVQPAQQIQQQVDQRIAGQPSPPIPTQLTGADRAVVDGRMQIAQEVDQRMQQPQPEQPGFLERFRQITPSFEEQARIARGTILEPAAAITTGAIAEPVAGAAGLGALVRGAGPEVAEQEIEAVREAVTFEPRTELAKKTLKTIGGVLAPVGEALQDVRKSTGDLTLRATGSPAAAAIATALPDATIEALGFGVGRKLAKAKTGMKAAPPKMKNPISPPEKAVTKSLLEAAPEVNQIKDASRAIYKEIDDLDIAAKPIATQNLVNKVVKRAREANVDQVLHPDSARVVKLFKRELADPSPKKISDFDRLRQTAQDAAGAQKPSDARIGAMMVDEIDEFLDKLPSNAFAGPDVQVVGQIGERYKAARNLWGRARRAELINDAFDKAGRQASGFENGVRTQMRSILNNKKRARFFTKDELAAMDDVVKGTGTGNILKLVGRLGLSEGSATNILGGLGGAAVLGPGAPVVGQISRSFAQKATVSAARKMEALIRGGAQGRKIATAYMQAVPKGKRSVQELSDLLLSSGSEVDDLLDNASRLVKEAAEIARARKIFERAEALGAAAPAIALPQQEQQ